MVRLSRILLPVLAALTGTMLTAGAQTCVMELSPAVDSINRYMASKAYSQARISIDTFLIDKKGNVNVVFGSSVTDFPLRDRDLDIFMEILRPYFPEGPAISFSVSGQDLGRYCSGFLSGRPFRSPESDNTGDIWITDISSPYVPTGGLYGRNIALWAGHGYYYSHTEDRWKWQRAPFFSTIEDLLPLSYVNSFLAPMLENAGATVLLPRERDYGTEEIIVDNGDYFYTERNGETKSGNRWTDAPGKGFADNREYYRSGENPFSQGTARMIGCNLKSPSSASYLPYFPKAGEYAVYVSYASLPKSAPALYTVRHSGGESQFVVDQSMGGGTWVYLGTFCFSEGETGQGVIVRNSASESKGQGVISTDAVRFGGGKGNILRGGQTSGFPRFAEASRYWLQWSGFPEEVYSLNEDTDDYKDDYMAKGEWVNSLRRDFHIPVDMALALHTDAGAVLNDSIIGTLAIYKEESEGKVEYSDGRPRILARELSDIVQTSIVDDIRAFYREDWTRRALWDRSYMEARVPDVPTVLIELLSHQNFPDMKCALDPKFKFIVSRAIYKGILKYLSYTSGKPYTVQPLPVKSLSAVLQNTKESSAEVFLEWSPTADPSEPSATPESYIVYRRMTDPSDTSGNLSGFDNGTIVDRPRFSERIEAGLLYSYKIVAVNAGGRSFPSEIMSVGYNGGREILVVNGFTDVTAPATQPVCDSVTAGFDFKAGYGIPYVSDCSYIGEQYEYRRQKDWIHDDRPGFGASYMDYSQGTVAGNTFDYPRIHGLALMRSGYSFSSASLEAVLDNKVRLGEYPAADFIFGKEADGFLSDSLYRILSSYCGNGGALLISGANIGKCTEYESGRQYPGTELLRSASSALGDAADRLSALRGTLSHDTELVSDIDCILNEITLLAENTGIRLRKDVTDFYRKSDPDFIAGRLASDIFGYGWSNGAASTTGRVRTVGNPFGLFRDSTLQISFPTGPNPVSYCVESPDAILPSDDRAHTFMRYELSNTSAAVAYDGDYRCVSFGFPIETLTSQHQVDCLMCEVMRFLLKL